MFSDYHLRPTPPALLFSQCQRRVPRYELPLSPCHILLCRALMQFWRQTSSSLLLLVLSEIGPFFSSAIICCRSVHTRSSYLDLSPSPRCFDGPARAAVANRIYLKVPFGLPSLENLTMRLSNVLSRSSLFNVASFAADREGNLAISFSPPRKFSAGRLSNFCFFPPVKWSSPKAPFSRFF